MAEPSSAPGVPTVAGPWQCRWQPLLEQWIIVSASTATRPWSGALAGRTEASVPAHDPHCYLCPRVVRANGIENPDYHGAFAFDNDFPSLSPEAPATRHDDPLARVAPAAGRCRVLCWSERHDATLASLDAAAMLQAAALWRGEYRRLAALPDIANVLIFENKGAEVGVSNLHPHGQIYATGFVTDTATRLRNSQATWARAHGTELIGAMLEHPQVRAELVIEADEHFAVIVPFAARFAYESWIVPQRTCASLADMDDSMLGSLARLYQRQARRYDLLFERRAPNVTLLHNVPTDDHDDNLHWRFHLAFQPPLRDRDKLKFLAGFESGSNNIVNPTRPEDAAERLRAIDVECWADRFAPTP